ncbi:MAG TPA: threonine synthase [Nitrososphaerales archaeon]|nr:threonine synthase [Nitrososphaerales archaeon]
MSRVADGWTQRCVGCGKIYENDVRSYVCTRCSNLLELVKDTSVSKTGLYGESTQPGLWRYRKALPIEPDVKVVSLSEGHTPLVLVSRIGAKFGLKGLHVKNEGQNPSGSFKDRGMTVAVTRAVQGGSKLLICASTGNTAASMAAYAARAGVTAMVTVPAGKVASGKLTQVYAYGAKIIRVEGDFDAALSMTLKVATEIKDLSVMNSVNPYRIEGQKTNAYEIFEQLGFKVPDYVVLPVGNAGNISAIWKGFKELKEWGISGSLPRMVAVQAAGAQPIVEAFQSGRDSVIAVQPKTIASAINIGNPASWKKALAAIRDSKGTALAVTDEETIAARMDLASSEGIFVEPASAVPIAALKKLMGKIEKDATVVCVCTGNGLKDQESVKVKLDSTPLVASPEQMVSLLAKTA